MATNKIALRTVDQFMSDYTPIYQPLYPLFLSKSQQYSTETGELNFRRVQTVGDIRAHHITPKDTDINQVNVMEGKKTFKKYFLANQFILSQFQDRQGVEEVIARVLDEHQVQSDEMFLTGEGTSASTMLNNGLYWSDDANYALESSVEVALTDRLSDFHSKVMTTVQKANQVSGRKVIVFYGANIIPLVNSLYPNGVAAWKQRLQDVLGGNYSIVIMPEASTPASANGWIVANYDQCKLHYAALPQLLAQGMNEEKMYLWSNFMMGSMMLEVLAQNAVVRQPATLETN